MTEGPPSGEQSNDRDAARAQVAPAAAAPITPAAAFERLSRYEYDFFLSYSNQDRARARAIVERLRKAGLTVFWDRDVLSGALWRPALTKGLEKSQYALVLWSKASMQSVWVQAEAEKALKDEKFHQVLLDQVELELPFSARQVAADLSTWDPERDASHENVEQLVDQLTALVKTPVQSLEQSLQATGHRAIRYRRMRQFAWRVSAPIAILVAFLLASGLLDRVWDVDTRLRLVSTWARAVLTRHELDPRITFVRIDQDTYKAFGRENYGASWRGELAMVIKNLAARGASVVALDIALPINETASDTDAVAGAIEWARTGRGLEALSAECTAKLGGRSGTVVVVAVKHWLLDGSGPNVEPAIQRALLPKPRAAPGYLGVPCGGTEDGFATTFPLLVEKQAPAETLMSLSLATAMAARVVSPGSWTVDDFAIVRDGDRTAPIRRSGEQRASEMGQDCSVIAAGDRVVELFIDQARGENPWPRIVPFEKAVHGEIDERALCGNIALVGVDDGTDTHRVWPGGEVAGVKLHADAITTILNGVALRRLAAPSQFLVILALGAAAAWCRAGIGPGRRLRRALMLGAVVVADLGLVVISSTALGLFMDVEYHLIAIALAYWYAERLEGRFFLPEWGRAKGRTA